MSILIVDDTEDNIILLQALLKKDGHSDLIPCRSAMEAFRHLGITEGGAVNHSSVDLILMDFMMPEISGVEACRKIKSIPFFSDIPIIMVTAKTEVESLDEAFHAGAMDYLTKPLRKLELLARVKSAMKLKQEMDRRKERERELTEKNQSLEKALSEIKTLRGFLPICCLCKKIRNMEGLWQQMESYMQEHAEVKFSHGYCEECLKSRYPEYYNKEAKKK